MFVSGFYTPHMICLRVSYNRSVRYAVIDNKTFKLITYYKGEYKCTDDIEYPVYGEK